MPPLVTTLILYRTDNKGWSGWLVIKDGGGGGGGGRGGEGGRVGGGLCVWWGAVCVGNKSSLCGGWLCVVVGCVCWIRAVCMLVFLALSNLVESHVLQLCVW